ncbi:MAG: VWA domain-containing protein [Deltaproteobacteria bacterium]|nr:VWA domain-containing protein [Deltaproteobacteria bacterium]
MRTVTLQFINALRAAGLRISLSESMDALRAVAAIGVEREMFRESLATCLVKEEDDRGVFDETFAHFFAGPPTQRRGKHHEQGGEQGEKRQVKIEGVGGRPQEQPQPQSRPSQQLPQSSRKRSEQPVQQEATFRPFDAELAEEESTTGRRPEKDETGFKARRARQKALLEKPFKAFDARDVEASKELMEQLAREFRSRLSRRYKRRKRGRLDFRRTIRAAIPHGGVAIDLRFRGRRPGKPDLLALCDLSGSVALVSDFLLALLSPASAFFRRVRTFAYVDRLCEVSFEHGHVVPHAELDLYARSDFGQVLQHFWREHGEQVLTPHTVVLILGDARNNRRPPRPDILARMRTQVKTLVWLNPEPRERWNTGDSVISLYARASDEVLPCGNLRELLAALNQAL